MKPPPFSYAAPETIDECVALLSQYDRQRGSAKAVPGKGSQ